MTLSDFYMITGADPHNKTAFLQKLHQHLQHGIKLVQLRAKQLSVAEYQALAKEVLALSKPYQTTVMLNTDLATALALDAGGIHLTTDSLMKVTRGDLEPYKIISAACHTLEQLTHAEKLAVDFVTLSPIKPTNTHPNTTPLGWEKFATLARTTTVPIYALGGLGEEDLSNALTCGAAGIAAINSLWNKSYE